jgi:hypothetical protein
MNTLFLNSVSLCSSLNMKIIFHTDRRKGGYLYLYTGVDKIMEAPRNWGIEIVCIGYIERTSVCNAECSSSVCLHTVVFVSVHSWLCWVTDRMKEQENGGLVQMLFPNNDAPIHPAGIVQSCCEEHEGELQHPPWPAQSPTWTSMNHLVSFGDYSEEHIPTSNISKTTWRCSSRRMV